MSAAVDCIVVGAGMSGLMAAARLRDAGRRVVVLDKGRGMGGRMATRRFNDTVCDHGAQFMTVRSQLFQQHVDAWAEAGLVTEWYRSMHEAEGVSTGHPRYRGAQGMTAVPKALAATLDVRLQSVVSGVRRSDGMVEVELADQSVLHAPAAVLTPPIPQTLALLETGRVVLQPDVKHQLDSVEYDPCIAVIARLDGPSGFAAPGFRSGLEGPIAWIADNQIKGISQAPAVTIHASGEFSRRRWDADRDQTGRELCQAAEALLSASVTDFQVHGWRYSQPTSTYPSPYAVACGHPLILLAGDAFQGPRVEGAALSGLAAAERILAAAR